MRAIHQQIRDRFETSRTIGIVTHVHPDGDAVGSVLALESFLKRRGKQVVVVSPHSVPKMYEFLGRQWTPLEKDQDCEVVDCVVVFDCPNKDRAGAFEQIANDATFVINIDHHVSNVNYGQINVVDVKASSCCELLFDLLESFTESLDQFEMSCLFVGMSTDTGSFRYSNVRSRTFEIVAQCVRAGLDITHLNDELYSRCPLKKFKLLQSFLRHVEIDVDSRVAWCIIEKTILDEVGAKRSDTEGFIDLIRDINEVETAMVLFEVEDGRTKASLRSKGKIDVNMIAQQFGGGGHVRAAGCTIDATPKNALVLLKESLNSAE